ncbi:hypothetical protein LTR86_010705 [Recurvomyces mirabilis]|nr:hypothetical protein LTR86_010705 [Recurvomyces mirabilis]
MPRLSALVAPDPRYSMSHCAQGRCAFWLPAYGTEGTRQILSCYEYGGIGQVAGAMNLVRATRVGLLNQDTGDWGSLFGVVTMVTQVVAVKRRKWQEDALYQRLEIQAKIGARACLNGLGVQKASEPDIEAMTASATFACFALTK